MDRPLQQPAAYRQIDRGGRGAMGHLAVAQILVGGSVSGYIEDTLPQRGPRDGWAKLVEPGRFELGEAEA